MSLSIIEEESGCYKFRTLLQSTVIHTYIHTWFIW